ncbi:hypothetical protein [Paenibacillus sonchi]|uniref:hypothetical protein n=1 Tax=Paenibacillus sonchi TaxID=373687 RepID=UPI001F44F263|nr:hypothetical protein [Paenibacillus sonchi]
MSSSGYCLRLPAGSPPCKAFHKEWELESGIACMRFQHSNGDVCRRLFMLLNCLNEAFQRVAQCFEKLFRMLENEQRSSFP